MSFGYLCNNHNFEAVKKAIALLFVSLLAVTLVTTPGCTTSKGKKKCNCPNGF